MATWLQHPGFQSAVVPLVVALIVALLLERPRLSGVAVLAGALACVHLTIGLDLFPLNATRRIVLLAIAGATLGALLDYLPAIAARIRTGRLVPPLAAAAVVWTLLTALSHRETAEALLLGAGLALFAAVTAFGHERLSSRPIRAGCAALAGGLTTGFCALMSASASLGQIGLALGAAAGGYLLVSMVRGRPLPGGRTLTLSAGLMTALIAPAAVVLAQLPWYALPVLAVVPFAASLPIVERAAPWAQAVVHGTIAFAAGLGAVAIAWSASAASSSGY